MPLPSQPFELREPRFRCTWGGTGLEPLDIENRKVFAEGRRLTKGYYIDFIGNFDRSAKDGLPIYRISEVLGSFGLRALIRKVAVVRGSRR